MFKIKSHNRYRSQQQTQKIIKNNKSIKLIKNYFKKTDTQTENLASYELENKRAESKEGKILILRGAESYRNSVGCLRSDRIKLNDTNDVKMDLKKQKKMVECYKSKLVQICKWQLEQSLRRNVLKQLIQLTKVQIQSKIVKGSSKMSTQPLTTEDISQIINKQRGKIQSVLNLLNKNLGEIKIISEAVKRERKFRIVNEGYFHHLQKEIRYYQNLYNSILLKNVSNKLLHLMISSKDIVSNGHVLALRQDNQKEQEKDLNKNSYMCLPKLSPNEMSEIQFPLTQRKSQKFIGKKGALKKLNKILSFVKDSKALESSQMQLYQQQQCCQKERPKIFSFFKTQSVIGNSQGFLKNEGSGILRKKPAKRFKPRSGKIVSIKFIGDIYNFYLSSYDETVYQLFRFYQQLGINMFGPTEDTECHLNGQKQDFFHYDDDQLLERSSRRLKHITMLKEKIQKFNATYDRKMAMIQKNIFQAINFVQQVQKVKKLKAQNNQQLCEVQQSASQVKSDKQVYIALTKLLNVDHSHFNSQHQVQLIIEKLNSSIKVQQDEAESSNSKYSCVSNQSSEKENSESKQQLFMSEINSHVLHKKKYTSQMSKTQGSQQIRKFHQLILHQSDVIDDKQEVQNKSKQSDTRLNQSCRSIYENGMKSLDNIFQNLKVCNAYQRAFERKQFENEYSKQITKKKRVMFRREARVLPTMGNSQHL